MTDAVIGEPEATMFVKHDVIGCAQRNVTTMRIEICHFASVNVDFLNSSTDVLRRIKLARQSETGNL